MKKALFVILLCFLYSGAGAQGFMLGDSITVHLTRLNLIENKGAGNFSCNVISPADSVYRVAGLSPYYIGVLSKAYIITSTAYSFRAEAYKKLYAFLCKKYGASFPYDGAPCWIRENVGATLRKSYDGGYVLLLKKL